MALRLPTAEQLEASAALLTIELKGKGRFGPFRLTRSQRKLARLLALGGNVIVCKSRQEGFSTLGGFWLFCLALANPGLKFVVVLQKQRAAEARLAEIKKFAVQLGLPLVVDQAAKFVLPNGAEVHALGAQGAAAAQAQTDVSRGDTYAAALFSESAFWRSSTVYQALKPAIGDGPILVESTAAGAFGFFWELWKGAPENGWQKLFVGIEESERCVADPDSIDDEEWEALKAEHGFTSRPHAAWWAAECKAMGGDTHGMLYEYPVLEEHPFRAAKGLWVHRAPAVIEPLRTTSSGIEVFEEHDHRLRYVQAYDVSEGVGADYSVTAVYRLDTGALVASWSSNTEPTDRQEDRVVELARMYGPDAIVVDKVGVGASALPRLRAQGLVVLPADSGTEAGKYRALLAAKRAIEAGELFGPAILADEAGELTVQMGPQGRRVWRGRKDALMCSGYALDYREANPWTPPSPDLRERVYRSLRRREAGGYYD